MRARIGSLFSGYGGLDLAVSSAFDAETVWHCELEDAPSRILAHHWPDAPNLGDITTVDWSQVEPVDILTGGFPCQDVSHAGRRAGLIRDGEGRTRSGLWGEMLRAITELQPRMVVAENVRGLLSAGADSDVEPCPWCLGDGPTDRPMRALGAVLADLADAGYDAAWTSLRAADGGAPHGRFRVFILAWDAAGHAEDSGRDRGASDREALGAPGKAGEPDRRAHRVPGPLLRTPTAQLAVNGGTQHPDQRRAGGHGPTLADEVEHLLPTPAAARSGRQQSPSPGAAVRPSLDMIDHLLPTPTAMDSKASGGAVGSSNVTLTDATVRGRGLLPTPSVADVEGGRKTRSGARNNELLLNGIAHEQRFGDYAPAIARWEQVLGRPAPAPTEPAGRGGAHRLSPTFVEWLMGLPAGHVTAVPGITRNQALKALGNGVVPQQGAEALRRLLAIRETALREPEAS